MLETKRAFTLFLLITLGIKLAIAFTLPFTTDEAYFYIWGLKPDWGFYDHPPMVGWMYWLLQQFSNLPGVFRLPSVLFTTFIGWAVYRLVSLKDPEKGLLAGMLYLSMPVNLYGVLVSTDTTLILFMFLSVAAFYFAVRRDSLKWFVVSGLLLGLAVLSKYFSALLGFSYLVYFLAFERNRRGFFKLFIVYAMTLPALALNIYWNYEHCWTNVLFNFVNRFDRGSGFSLWYFLGYLSMWVYLLVPPTIYYLYQRRKEILALKNTPERVFLIAYFVPIGLFLALSLFKVIGLHWVLGFYPFIFVILGLVADKRQIKNGIKATVVLSLIHVVFFAVLIASPLSIIKPDSKYYSAVVLGSEPQVFLDAIKQYRGKYTLASIAYSDAAVMTFHAGENVSVLGMGSSHARHDDIMTDFRKLDGKNILVFYYDKAPLEALADMFQSVQYQEVHIEQATYYVMLGDGFNYQKYHDKYLQAIKKFYQIPKFLPRGECYFYQRYFPGEKY